MLIEEHGAIFDSEQLKLSHGFEEMDLIGKEAYVNHIHFEGKKRLENAENKIREWEIELKSKWKNKIFRIYKQNDKKEIIIRFHMVRANESNWTETGNEIIEIRT